MSTDPTENMRQHFQPDGSPERLEGGTAGANCAVGVGSAGISKPHCCLCGTQLSTVDGDYCEMCLDNIESENSNQPIQPRRDTTAAWGLRFQHGQKKTASSSPFQADNSQTPEV